MQTDTMPRVILIDDEDSIRTMMKALVSSMGCEVVGEAANGRDGIEIFKKEKPDLVLLDIQMPEMRGDVALDFIMDEDPNARVVLLTSVSSPKFLYERLEAGAHAYIQKHAPLEDIKKALQRQIDKVKQSK